MPFCRTTPAASGGRRVSQDQVSPSFQRRPVWQPKAKSYLVDTVAKNLPVPVIFIRERINLNTQETTREVVDGQQRLRTLFTYIDPKALKDFKAKRDPFVVSPQHNRHLAGKSFAKLDDDTKRQILGYEFSTHVLPSTTEDRDVLMIFARLNSTGVQLNGQELRNAEYFGLFKSLMYELALEQLERWRQWTIFSEEQIARMSEVELTSDLVMTMIKGLTGKTQQRLDDIYEEYDNNFPAQKAVTLRFRRVMDAIDEVLGSRLPRTVFSSEVYFYSLFTYTYDRLYGLGSKLDASTTPAKLNVGRLRTCLLEVSANFTNERVPSDVLDAIVRASADTGRRRTRHKYLAQICNDSAK